MRTTTGCILLGAILTASATAGAAGSEPRPLFAEDGILRVTIDAPIATLMDVRPDEAYLKGSFTFTDLDGAEKRVSLKLRTRGNFRRKPEHCDFAPIRLNFVKSEVKNTLFDGQDKLKLVTHCKTWEEGFEEYVFREYLAYRIYQVLTDVSYRVRLLDITYFDTQKDGELNRIGFVIEDDGDVRDRNDLEKVKVRFLDYQYYDRQYRVFARQPRAREDLLPQHRRRVGVRRPALPLCAVRLRLLRAGRRTVRPAQPEIPDQGRAQALLSRPVQ